jgi:probable rRNA maturation factor
MLSIEISNRQNILTIDIARLRRAVAAVMGDARVTEGELSIAVVDDPTIHALNRQYLEHDYPTDVLSFVLERDGARLEGEVIVSSETAIRSAARWGWPPEDELLLYVVHGTLHLVGFEDTTDDARTEMRQQERRYLALLEVRAPEDPLTGEA